MKGVQSFSRSLIAGFMFAGLLALGSLSIADEIRLSGAGATFPNPVYQKWMYKYHELTGVEITYQSIGSGGGIQQIKAKTVDFGASDAPLEAKELGESGLLQFPLIMGGVVPVVNIPGIKSGALKLSSQVLADIFLGKITKWNDPAIVKANSDLKLPGIALTVVHRADGSGTTWIFTNYLAKVSKEWEQKVGWGKAVEWPAGVGGKGNEGVAAFVQGTAGAIGYVEYAYAQQSDIPVVTLQNRDGIWVKPTLDSFQAAAANADWQNAPGFYLVLTDQPGEQSWPITGASFILMYKHQPDARKADAMLKFFDWCFRKGADDARGLNYVPMPETTVKLIRQAWEKEVIKGSAPAKANPNGK
jgi:phosphate transport system substrate-binding protein